MNTVISRQNNINNNFDFGCKRASSILVLILVLASLMATLLVMLESETKNIPMKEPLLNTYTYNKTMEVIKKSHEKQQIIRPIIIKDKQEYYHKPIINNNNNDKIINENNNFDSNNNHINEKKEGKIVSSIISNTMPLNNNNNDRNSKNNIKIMPIEEQSKPKPKIAYVFAGSARSFVCPKVHWTLKINLIDALGGSPYVFIRMALEDNLNTKTGLGKIWTPNYDSGELNETLKVLNPTTIEYFSFANQLEEMRAQFPSKVHEVFRMNDQRRYSMYYHRCMAYKLVTNYEQENNMKFDWVVLVRLDAQWLDPVLPIESYSNDRVWLTETGFVLFNDQFMLIPRQFSDYLYDLDTKVSQRGVYCLGGPDVELWKCDANALRKKGVGEEMVNLTIQACCADVLAGSTRRGENQDGFSETIHLRHLRMGKIPVGVAYFPVLLTRIKNYVSSGKRNRICEAECGRLYYNAKEYLFAASLTIYPYFKNPVWPDTRFRPLSIRDQVVCEMVSNDMFPWRPISASQFHHNTKFRRKSDLVDYSKVLMDQRENLDPSIFLDPRLMEMYRIHPFFNAQGCLTVAYSKDYTTEWDYCNDHSRKRGGLRWDPQQLFFLLVNRPTIPSIPKDHPYSLFHTTSDAFQSHVHSASNRYFKEEDNADTSNDVQFMRIIQLFRHFKTWSLISRAEKCLTAIAPFDEKSPVNFEDCLELKSPNVKSQYFLPIQTNITGSHPFTYIGKIRLFVNPNLCVARSDNFENHELNATSFHPRDGKLYLLNCRKEGRLFLTSFEFELITT